MALFMTVERLRVAMGLPDSEALNAALQETLGQVTVIMQQAVRTESFERRVVTDTFFIHESLEYGAAISRARPRTRIERGVAAVSKMKLSHGFVDLSVTPTGVASGTVNGLVDPTATNLRATLNNEDVMDFSESSGERGVLRVHDYSLSNCYVQVTYTAGFLQDDGDPSLFVGTPDWLVEAAKLKAMIDLGDHPLIARQAGGEESARRQERDQSRNQQLFDQIMLKNSRYVPMTQGTLRKTTWVASAT